MGETILGLADWAISNLVWVCVAVGAIIGLSLGVVIFKDKRRWIWRSLVVAAIVLIVMWATNIAYFYTAYTETKEPNLGAASRMTIGHDNPVLAKDIEFLIVGAEKQEWVVSGLLERKKTYSDERGTAVITRHLFSTDIVVETGESVWSATCLFGKVKAEIEF